MYRYTQVDLEIVVLYAIDTVMYAYLGHICISLSYIVCPP